MCAPGRTHRSAPTAIAGYLALAGELSVNVALGRYAEAGCLVAVPAYDAEAGRYRFCRWSPEAPVAPGRFKVLEPLEKAWVATDAFSLFLVPGVAFDVSGNRLGHGAGIYDALLAAAAPDARFVGIAYDEQILDAVPAEPHDIPMHGLATPTRFLVTHNTEN